MWLRNHEPKNFDKLRKVLLPKDEIRRRLTGEYATDLSDASGTLLLDVARRRWSTALLSKLELDADLLPRAYESEQVTGQLTREAAAELGLSTDCLVVGGAGDCAAGAVGNGIVAKGVISTSIGTSGVMFAHSDTVEIDPEGRVHTFCHAVHGKWHMMGVTLAAGGSLQWFQNELCHVNGGENGQPASADIYDVLNREAEGVPPGSQGLFFLPYLSGERTPHADPDARGCFIGLSLAHRRGHMLCGSWKGWLTRFAIASRSFASWGFPCAKSCASGGGSKSPLWRQIQADVFGQRVSTINAEEGPAYGVALLAAVGAGAFKNVREACSATIRVVDTTPPQRAAVKTYDRAFPEYQQLYRSLRHDFRRIAALQE